MQNFKPVGPRISEISRQEKKTSGLKLKSAPQAIAFGGTNNAHVHSKNMCEPNKYKFSLPKMCPQFLSDDMTVHVNEQFYSFSETEIFKDKFCLKQRAK